MTYMGKGMGGGGGISLGGRQLFEKSSWHYEVRTYYGIYIVYGCSQSYGIN